MNQPLLWRKRRIFTIFTLICCLSLSVPLSILWTNRYVIPFEVDQEVYLNNNNRHTVNGTIYRDRDDPFANAFTQKWKGFSLKDSLSFSSSVPFSALVERVIAKAKIKDKIVWRSSSEYPLHCGNYRDLLNITTEIDRGFLKTASLAEWKRDTRSLDMNASSPSLIVLTLDPLNEESKSKRHWLHQWVLDLSMIMELNECCPDIVERLYGYCTEDPPRIFVEYLPLGSGHSFLRRFGQGRLSMTPIQRFTLAINIADNLQELHDAGYVVCDFPNFGILSDYNVKLMDGGSLRAFPPKPGSEQAKATLSSRIETICGTPNKAASCTPEIAMRESFSPLTNVWELGIVLIQLFQADHDELQHCLHWSNGTKTKDEMHRLCKKPSKWKKVQKLVRMCPLDVSEEVEELIHHTFDNVTIRPSAGMVGVKLRNLLYRYINEGLF